jgi:tetratricopeptide (TPR) repeat protein
MSQKVYQYILKFGVYISLLSAFLVYKRFLFPYITSKQIFFNIIIEILFVFWIAYIIKFPQYRPKKSWITFGLASFFAALLLSCITTVDFNLSFWGDVERMLGVFHILHFLGLYLIIITVFDEWRDWKVLLIISIAFSVFISLYGLSGPSPYSTIGNVAYVAGYLIFNIYFVLILFFKEKNTILRWLYLIPLFIMMLEFKKVSVSGAYVGLGFSIIVLFFLYAVLNKNKKIRYITLSFFVLMTVIAVFGYLNKDAGWVKSNPFLEPLSEITFEKDTFQTRLISWKAAFKDLPNHIFLGTGHGNFAITFDKHFDSKFYDFTRNETYFDRAHNNLIDILSTTGIVGLITYISIFLAAAYYLILGYIRKKINVHEFILISCLIIAYFVQNLAVFDSLVTYISLMITLAFVYWLNQESEETLIDKAQEKANNTISHLSKDKKFSNSEIYSLVLVGILSVLLIYNYNYKVSLMLIGTIDGQRAYGGGDLNKTIEIYKDVLDYNTILDRDSRTTIIRIFSSNPNSFNNLDPEKRDDTINFLVEQAEKNVKYNPGDSLNQMMYAQLLNSVAVYYRGNEEKFNHYSNRALEAIDKSIEASPERVPIYFQKAQILLSRNENDKAIETLKYALSLNEEYYDSHCYLAKTLFFLQKEEEGFKYMDECISLGGAKLLSPTNFVGGLLQHYLEQEDWDRSVKLYERLTQLESKNVKIWIDLANLYKKIGNYENAIRAAQKTADLDASISSFADEFISSIKEENKISD